MKKLSTVVCALVVLLSITMSASALESKSIYRQNGISASGDWSEPTADGGYVYKYLSAAKTDDGVDLYVSICTSDMTGNYSCKSGYKFTQENVFDMDRKLASATLSPVEIDLYDWYTPTVETVTIQVQWTGIGDAIRGSYKSMSRYGDFSSKYSESTISRDATATGSINDQDLGASNFAGMIRFKYASMYMEK